MFNIVLGNYLVKIAANGPRIGEGAEKKALTFNFTPTVAKPFFYLLIYIFVANKKWFLRKKKHKRSTLPLLRSFANTMLVAVLIFRFSVCYLLCTTFGNCQPKFFRLNAKV